MVEEKPYKFILRDKQGRETGGDFYDYHYMVSTYVNTVISAGFTLVGMEEVIFRNSKNVAAVSRHPISTLAGYRESETCRPSKNI